MTITGYLSITAWHVDFRNLSFLRNLETIGKNLSHRNIRTLNIDSSSLKSLNLQSLNKIYGTVGVSILYNAELCYIESTTWDTLTNLEVNKVLKNRDKNHCREDGFVCDDFCSEKGCWGEGSDQCLSCGFKYFKNGTNCVVACPENAFPRNEVCISCHSQCETGCNGPSFKDCNIFQKQKIVVKKTCNRTWEYPYQNGCRACNIECKGGCTGPDETECNACEHVKDAQTCLSRCPIEKYENNGRCHLCNIVCQDGCTGPGANTCVSCKHVRDGENCLYKCPDGKFESNGRCQLCNVECKDECIGAGANNCISCKHVRDEDFCISKCSAGKYNLNGKCVSLDGYGNPTNKEDPHEQNSTNILIFGIIVLIVLITTILFIGICYVYHEKIIKFCKRSVTDQIQERIPLTEELLNNSSMTQLPMIKESEIHKLQILGSGAFGTVHEAIWRPEDTNDNVSVAVKVLHDNSTVDSIKEFLDEAIIMAKMDHPNVVHLIAVCVTTEVMLLTKLMPLGCLLNYVRINKRQISPKSLLDWITQIAKGMAYLEQRHLVHRDLAARNILLETVDCIKISDFGLSKFVGTSDFASSNTKFPIKWLALECLEEKHFTHKSDVWAFGVTTWELLTFGERPFDKMKSHILIRQLKLGLKLVQPAICSADIYATLVRCWLLRPELRPDFTELENTFRKMSYEPSKYLSSYGEAHFKKLNNCAEESTENPRLTWNSTNRKTAGLPFNYLSLSVDTHCKYQAAQSTSSEQGYYLVPSNQQASNDSGCYDLITNIHSTRC